MRTPMKRQELIESIVELLERWEEREAVKAGKMSRAHREVLVARRLDNYYKRKMKEATSKAEKDFEDHRKMYDRSIGKMRGLKRKINKAKKLEAKPSKIRELENEMMKRQRVNSKLAQRRLKKHIEYAKTWDAAHDKYGRWRKHADNIHLSHMRRTIAGDEYKPTSTEKMLGAARPKPKKSFWQRLFRK